MPASFPFGTDRPATFPSSAGQATSLPGGAGWATTLPGCAIRPASLPGGASQATSLPAAPARQPLSLAAPSGQPGSLMAPAGQAEPAPAGLLFSLEVPPTCLSVLTGLLTSVEGKVLSLSWKMRGLKRKRRKFTRTLKGLSSSDQKVTDFDFATYQSEQDLTTANDQY